MSQEAIYKCVLFACAPEDTAISWNSFAWRSKIMEADDIDAFVFPEDIITHLIKKKTVTFPA